MKYTQIKKIMITFGLIATTLSANPNNEIHGYKIIPLPLANATESICGDSTDWLDVENYDGSLGPSRQFVKTYEKSTARLILPLKNSDRAYSCTGTLTTDNHFITAGHCISSNVDRNKIFALFISKGFKW